MKILLTGGTLRKRTARIFDTIKKIHTLKNGTLNQKLNNKGYMAFMKVFLIFTLICLTLVITAAIFKGIVAWVSIGLLVLLIVLAVAGTFWAMRRNRPLLDDELKE